MEGLLETHQPEKNGTVSKQGAVWKMFLLDKNIRIAPSRLGFALENSPQPWCLLSMDFVVARPNS